MPEPAQNIRPLIPRLLLNSHFETEEIAGEIPHRFNLPAAKFTHLPPGFFREIYSQSIGFSEDNLQDYLEEDAITYTAISNLRYETAAGFTVYLTTLLMSNKAAQLEYKSLKMRLENGAEFVQKIQFKFGAEAIAFFNLNQQIVRNQLVFVSRPYYITAGSNLPLNALVQLVSDSLVVE